MSRDHKGRFVAGASGNRSGRPAGFAGVAAKILADTRGGAELVDFALEVWRDPKRAWTERVAMHQWLSDRGLGKAVQVSELTLRAGAPEPVDAERLEALATDEELAAIERLHERAALMSGSESSESDGDQRDSRDTDRSTPAAVLP